MSLLINNELIWISIPKCASVSIENSLLNSNLSIKKYKKYDEMIKMWKFLSNNPQYPPYHAHVRKSYLYDDFGRKETVRIKRDWFKRWISALQHMLETIHSWGNYNVIKKWEYIDNEFIYDFFDKDYVKLLHINDESVWDECFLKFVKETEVKKSVNPPPGMVSTLLSQNYWTENEACTYEFDINEMSKFEDFIFDKFGEKIIIKKLNTSSDKKSKVIFDDKLKEWVWNNFESQYYKKNNLI